MREPGKVSELVVHVQAAALFLAFLFFCMYCLETLSFAFLVLVQTTACAPPPTPQCMSHLGDLILGVFRGWIPLGPVFPNPD